jgi:hypothetical protein
MKNKKTILTKIAELLSEPSVAPYFPGLFRGKTGVSVFLNHYFSYCNDTKAEDAAFDLLQSARIQMKSKFNVNYPYGLSGLGTGIAYMIQKGFFDADPDEILEEYDASLLLHVMEFISLSSINQILGIGHYLSFRIKDSKRTEILKELIDKTILLIELHLVREPNLRADIATVLYDFKDSFIKAQELLDGNMSVFDNQRFNDDTWAWFLFFFKAKEIYPARFDAVNSLIINNKYLLSDAEHVMWEQITGSTAELACDELQSLVDQAITQHNYGLQNGLAGIGMSLLQSIDERHSSWLNLLLPLKTV